MEFLAVNTDAQHLSTTLTDNRLQIGQSVTAGLGCGANPDAGRMAAEESKDEIKKSSDVTNLLQLFRVTNLDNYIELFAEGEDEDEQDMYKVLALNLGGVTTSAFFEERFFSSAGKVWNNGTLSLKPQQKFEIKTIVGKEATFIERVLENSAVAATSVRVVKGQGRQRRRQRRCGVVGEATVRRPQLLTTSNFRRDVFDS